MALSQQAKATTTVTRTVELKPTVRRKLLTELQAYHDLKERRDAIEAAMDEHKANIGSIREATGEKAILLEGFKITRVEPTRKTLNHAKLIELGCAAAWIEEATESKPTKAYDKVTCPGEIEKEY